MYYCYAYLDPRYPGPYEYRLENGKRVCFSHLPFYVGKGKGNRFEVHLKAAATSRRRHPKLSKIRKLLKLGLLPIIRKTSNTSTEKRAFELERLLILAIGRADLGTGPLTNLTDGGDGPAGYVPSESLKAHWSAVKRNRTEEEVLVTAEKRKATLAAKGEEFEREFRNRQRQALLNKSESQKAEIKAKMLATVEDRPIADRLVLSQKISESVRAYNAANPEKVEQAARKRTETLRTRRQRERASVKAKEAYEKNPALRVKLSRSCGGSAVKVYTTDGKFVGKFDTQAAAGRATGVPPSNVTAVLKGRHKFANGYVFRYL